MKAIALISGGLDSILAAKLMERQGVKILPLHFRIPFCHRDKESGSPGKDIAILVADNLSEKLKTVNISNEFLKLLINPRCGFGSNMNPCIDCKILMLAKAKELMPQVDAQFVVTGEVLGQRPMSQHRQALEIIEKRSGLEGLILRPLSAKLLAQTIPEKQGLIKRDRILSFSGRSRKPQINLARDLHIKDYPNAAGGCLLTDPGFTRRLKELIEYRELSVDNIELLKIGRHFRISGKTKLIVGRNEKESKELEDLAKVNDYLFFPNDELAGPTSLGRGEYNEDLVKFSCRATCRYCDLNGRTKARIVYREVSKKDIYEYEVPPLENDMLASYRI
jgi:tRNA U34 2-thiouridine synthase MnmA/TrmU